MTLARSDHAVFCLVPCRPDLLQRVSHGFIRMVAVVTASANSLPVLMYSGFYGDVGLRLLGQRRNCRRWPAVLRRLLIVKRGLEQQALGERPREELKADWHAVGKETAWHADRRKREARCEPPVGPGR